MSRIGFIGGALGYHLLRSIGARAARESACDGSAYCGRSKLEVLFGPDVWTALAGRVVIDFGCGIGTEAVEAAQHGARRVIGVDIRESGLELARLSAARAGVADRCVFTTHTSEKADVILSVDGFEHYEHPGEVLGMMRQLITADGRVLIAFGPPWYHPLGGHLISVFPWAHLIFSENSLIRWRSDFKSDGAKRFGEVEGGLNQMSVRRFRRLLDESEFEVQSFEAVPIRRLRLLSSPLTREFVTSTVRCRLVPRVTGLRPGDRVPEK